MFARWWAAHAFDRGLRSSTLAVGMAIVTRMNAAGEAWPSRERVMREAGIRDSRVFARAVRDLAAAGVLSRTLRRQRTALYIAGPALREVADCATSRRQEVADSATSKRQDVAENAPRDVAEDAPLNGHIERAQQNDSPPSPQPGRRMDWERWAAVWNEIAARTGLPRVRPPATWPETRKRALRARLAELGEEGLLDLLRAPLESSFLRGERGRESWPGATFDWILKPTNAAKVLDGAYRDRPDRRRGGAAGGPSSRQEWEGFEPGIFYKGRRIDVVDGEEDATHTILQ